MIFKRKTIFFQGSRGGPTFSGGGGGWKGSNFFQGVGPNGNFYRNLSKFGFSRQRASYPPSRSAHVLPLLLALTQYRSTYVVCV